MKLFSFLVISLFMLACVKQEQPLFVNAAFISEVDSGAVGGVKFTNQSTSAEPQTYLWSFGDNTTSTEKSPVHYYKAKQEYGVILRLIDHEGHSYAQHSSTSSVVTVSTGPFVKALLVLNPSSLYESNSSVLTREDSTIIIRSSSTWNPDVSLNLTLPADAGAGTYTVGPGSKVSIEFVVGVVHSWAKSSYPCSSGTIQVTNISSRGINGTFSGSAYSDCSVGFYPIADGAFAARF